ncbi:hypothetical protein K9M42_03440 [Patescibacteria group bacterium]|nr:hypothetical protein [Patescibacteria group bacterium]
MLIYKDSYLYRNAISETKLAYRRAIYDMKVEILKLKHQIELKEHQLKNTNKESLESFQITYDIETEILKLKHQIELNEFKLKELKHALEIL